MKNCLILHCFIYNNIDYCDVLMNYMVVRTVVIVIRFPHGAIQEVLLKKAEKHSELKKKVMLN